VFHVRTAHCLQLATSRCHNYLTKFSFGIRVINVWNSLPDNVISAESADAFRNRLDNSGRAKTTRLILKDLQEEVHYMMILFRTLKKINKLSLLSYMHAVNWYTKYCNSILFKFIMLHVVTLDTDIEVLCTCIHLDRYLIILSYSCMLAQ